MRILIAEDERITRSSLVRQLERWGHSVTAAEDGEEAWSCFGADEFDIVITDWEMPRLSGVELIQRIRAVTGSTYVYVIMLTSRSEKSDIISGIEAGADDYVSKPFDRDELRVRLLAGERVIRLERSLSKQNIELREASERMHRDLEAAARVQRAMVPDKGLRAEKVRTDFAYVPTDELAGDGLGFHLIDDRYLVAYIVDVTGHGVPAALLAVTAMQALSPTAEGASLLRSAENGSRNGIQAPSCVVSELNRRFCASDSDGRFLTMILCILDTHNGRMRFTRAGHPHPMIVRAGDSVSVRDDGGVPIGILDDAEYDDVELWLEPGDRVLLYSDGFFEQCDPSRREQFGMDRLEALLLGDEESDGEHLVVRSVESLAEWAGTDCFDDDLSLLVIEWRG